jgi:RNA polymerase sigma-70 factor, ECF subfamily
VIEEESDGDLVRRIAAGPGRAPDAEAELCRRFAPRVRLYGLCHLRSEERARDLVQAVLLAVLEAARAGRVEEADRIDRFMLGTCRNIAFRQRARDQRSVPTAEEELEKLLVPASELEPIETGALVRCLAALELRARTVLQLSYQHDQSAEEIAALLETTAGNVRVLRHRAVLRLRQCLDANKGTDS